MNKQPKQKKPTLLTAFAKTYSGSLTGTALSALSAWMIVIGLKGLAGFAMNQQTALTDLLGIIIVIGILRWVKFKHNAK
jgi:hypothetical protein